MAGLFFRNPRALLNIYHAEGVREKLRRAILNQRSRLELPQIGLWCDQSHQIRDQGYQRRLRPDPIGTVGSPPNGSDFQWSQIVIPTQSQPPTMDPTVRGSPSTQALWPRRSTPNPVAPWNLAAGPRRRQRLGALMAHSPTFWSMNRDAYSFYPKWGENWTQGKKSHRKEQGQTTCAGSNERFGCPAMESTVTVWLRAQPRSPRIHSSNRSASTARPTGTTAVGAHHASAALRRDGPSSQVPSDERAEAGMGTRKGLAYLFSYVERKLGGFVPGRVKTVVEIRGVLQRPLRGRCDGVRRTTERGERGLTAWGPHGGV
jgi:hypothetical protein